MKWILGLVIYFFLVIFLIAPFILSGRISRAEEESGITGDETVYQEKSDTPAGKGNTGHIAHSRT
jgi:hypothetical protein